MTNRKFFIKASPLFLALFIDGMGLGLLFPILNSIIMTPSASFLPEHFSLEARNLIYGLLIGSYMICWFFGAAILGDLSDMIGRKKSLIICLGGACIGYFFSALAIIAHSITLLLIGRVIAGFTAGSQPVAQAAVVDLSTPATKARNIGYIMLAVSLGFVLGPILGGILSDHNLLNWFDYTTPFYFASIISLINTLMLWYFLEETFRVKKKISIKWHGAITTFISAFKHTKIKHLSLIFLIFILGWSNYFTFIAPFLLKEYGYSTILVSGFMAALGFGFALGFSVLLNFCTKRFALKKIAIVTTAITALGILITIMMAKPIYAWLCVLPLTASVATGYAIMITLFSNQVDETAQGWVMGITGAIMSLAFGFTAVISGVVANLSPAAPLALAVIGLGASSLLLSLDKKIK